MSSQLGTEKVFVNFRVGDTEDAAVAIDQKLCRRFGAENVFRSSRAMHGGALFPATLEAKAAGCAVMLVIIGERWLVENRGARRIDEPGDWVRREIELALDNDRVVIPVLTGDRQRLSPGDALPASITGLLQRQYLRFHHRSAERDLVHIVDEVRHHTAERGIPVPGPANPVLLTSLGSTQRSADVRLGSAEISGRYFGDSIILQPSLFASQVRGTISYNLGMKFRRLEVTAGILDNASERDQIGVFKVITDGAVRTQVTAEHGRPRELTIDVTDVLSLQLEAHRPGTTAHPMLAGVMAAGGRSNKLPELAWGDPVVYP
jgi:hypothetical protein